MRGRDCRIRQSTGLRGRQFIGVCLQLSRSFLFSNSIQYDWQYQDALLRLPDIGPTETFLFAIQLLKAIIPRVSCTKESEPAWLKRMDMVSVEVTQLRSRFVETLSWICGALAACDRLRATCEAAR